MLRHIAAHRPANPVVITGDAHRNWVFDQRGYIRMEVTPGQWRADFRVSDTVLRQDAELYTLATFVTEDGKPGRTTGLTGRARDDVGTRDGTGRDEVDRPYRDRDDGTHTVTGQDG